MILGLIAGGVLRSNRSSADKVKWLLIAGVVDHGCGPGAGLAGHLSGGKTHLDAKLGAVQRRLLFAVLAAFYALTDVWNRRSWVFPLMVIGTNSIAAYCMDHLCGDFIRKNWQRISEEIASNFSARPMRRCFTGR